MEKHWSRTQLLHEVVTNPNIIIKGTHSYYSDCWDSGFEKYCVRYLQGDEISRQWNNNWELDKLYIGDYVCIAAEVIILMGGNHTHRADWFCLYPFANFINESYERKGDTIIEDGAWLGMRSILLPGVKIGEGGDHCSQ
ncbi:hypothetical protein N5853_02575 [Bartonella sp. HY329]|uniref:hypothetical protein n=1 Tax=unclassified Bartonella TaxID=2645622 RepID=UPI0021C9D6D7|nr:MULTISPECIES: hypothetical protein [unclassified Bartonella]UXM95537.1 hypothetical protein N5853_02575 [Bartonella sp. HY329]UXN09862.1 hypothetical protein N5852_02585 [Bartonella sp. HY328]